MSRLTIAILLGAYHGLNPAMGWLFAAALGLQERRATAVVQALPPITLGHATSVAMVVALAAGAQRVLSADVSRTGGAALMLGFAALLLLRRRHPRRVGMRLGARGLFAWSFVMATAHGAGLMLLPLILAPAGGGAIGHPGHAATSTAPSLVATHTAAMLLAMTSAALVAFRMSGVGFLRRGWIDTDLLWAAALGVTAVAVFASR